MSQVQPASLARSNWRCPRSRSWPLLSILVGAACAGDPATAPPADGPASIVLSTPTLRLESIGESVQLVATVKDRKGATVAATVAWTTDNPGVATISANGTVAAVANGSATVTALVGSLGATAGVTVQQKGVQITLSTGSVALRSIGEAVQLTATVKDQKGATVASTVVWTTDDPGVATISANGTVTAVANGSATVTAAAGSLTATATVTVQQQPAQVVLSPTSTSLPIGGTAQLTAIVEDSGGTAIPTASVSWASSDPTVVTVTPSGVVTAVGAGIAAITATAGAVSASSQVGVFTAADNAIRFTYVSPSRASNAQDQAAYEGILDKLANDPSFGWIGSADRQAYGTELQLYRSNQRTFAYHEPQDGSRFPGIDQPALDARAVQVEALVGRVRNFYAYHTGRVLRIAPLQVAPLEQSALHYWTPVIYSSTSVDRNPIVNKISDELTRRGYSVASRAPSRGDTIHVLLMDGGGGWAGAWQFDNFGGLAAVGDVSNCLDRPDAPGVESAAARARWPGHLQASWVTCTYNLMLGTVVHELGHTFGLPHPADFQCAGLADALVMQSHWNVDLASTGFFRPVAGAGLNLGIMKQWDAQACRPTDPTKGYAVGIGTTARPNGRFQSELAILLDNPQFR